MRSYILCSAALLTGWFAGGPSADAEQANGAEPANNVIRNTYGEIGIFDLPSAHMADDGQLAFTGGNVGQQQRYNLTFQALPWLEASFRYTKAVGYYDFLDYHRNFGLRARLFQEGTYTPDITIGIRNLIGTGRLGSEYAVASKHIGNFVIGSFDLTAGLGWGELAEGTTLPNPLGYALSSFKVRTPPGTPTGGTFDFGEFFHGPRVGVFGGAIWHTPLNGLSLLAEYSSDKYIGYTFPGGVKVRSPLNVGLNYQIGALSVSGGWLYGSTYGLAVTLQGDPTHSPKSAARIGPAVPPALVRDSTEQQGALRQMMDRNSNVAAARNGGPWVHIPTPAERTKQDLKQALLSETRGVRDLNVEGTTLVIDAQPTGDSMAQCMGYARIASGLGAHMTSVAMTDLQSSKGDVTFCPVGIQANYLQADAREMRTSNGKPSTSDPAAIERKVRADLYWQSLFMEAMSLGSNELWIDHDNYRFESEDEAIGRIARVLMADAPPSIEVFHIVAMQHGEPQQQVTVVRGALERATSAEGATMSVGQGITLNTPPLDNPAVDRAEPGLYPSFAWSLDPKLTEHLFDPTDPLQFMIYADATALVQLSPNWLIQTQLTGNIWNNYTFDRPAGSVLPHVRTDLLQYIKQGRMKLEPASDLSNAPNERCLRPSGRWLPRRHVWARALKFCGARRTAA